MSRIRTRRPDTSVTSPPASQKAVRRQLAAAAGAEKFQNRDPLFHVTESFRQTFDAVGIKHASELSGGKSERTEKSTDAPEKHADMTSSKPFYERSGGAPQDMLMRFSETAFQRGKMSAAVLGGTGKMMLFSCLKKTIGQSQPERVQQRKLFEHASAHRNVPGHSPDKVIFNRGFTDSAVGLVIDTLRDARRTVESMSDIAEGKSEMGDVGGAQMLNKMYPFLDNGAESGLLEQYLSQLEELDDGDTRRIILQNAVVHTRSLISRKQQMKQEFINKLRFISDRATEALAEFERPEFPDELAAALEATLDYPEDGGDDDDGEDTGPKDGGSAEGNGADGQD